MRIRRMRMPASLFALAAPLTLVFACSGDPYDAEPRPLGDGEGEASAIDAAESDAARAADVETAAPKAPLFAFVGSGDGKIRTYAVDRASGAWTFRSETAAGANPSFVAFDPRSRRMVAIDEVTQGTVSSFVFDPSTGGMSARSTVPTLSAGPVHISFGPAGEEVFIAHYTAGNTVMCTISPDGDFGVASTMLSTGPKSHWAGTDPSGEYLFVAVLETNKIRWQKLVPSGTTNEAEAPPGAGPRHIAFHPNGKWLYVINELAVSISRFTFDKGAGALTDGTTVSALPRGPIAAGVTGAEIVVHPNGKHVYASTRGYNSIVHFTVDPSTGNLTRVANALTGGDRPRSFAIDPDGTLLFAGNQAANHVVGFRVDSSTGALTPLGKTVDVPSPNFVGLAVFP